MYQMTYDIDRTTPPTKASLVKEVGQTARVMRETASRIMGYYSLDPKANQNAADLITRANLLSAWVSDFAEQADD